MIYGNISSEKGGTGVGSIRVFDQGDGLVDVMVVERKLFERNEAVNAWEWGIMR